MFDVKNRIIAAAALLAAGTSVQSADAGSILLQATRANNYTNSTTYTFVAVPLDDASDTSLNFKTTSNKQVIEITYNAECGALGNPGNWLAIEILVDGAETAPASGSSFAFCTAVSTTTYAWSGATRVATVTVPTKGVHTVQVMGYGAGTTTWWLGDTALVIKD